MRLIPHSGDAKRDWLQRLRQLEVNLTTRFLSPVSTAAGLWGKAKVLPCTCDRLAATAEH